jgi:CHASE2 domain-containing sensor protein
VYEEWAASAESLNNIVADIVMQLEFESSRKDLPNNIIFVDIDDMTRQRWLGDFATTSSSVPRDSVAILLARIVEADPAVLVVDISFDANPNITGASNYALQQLVAKIPDDHPNTAVVFAAELSQRHHSLRPTILQAYARPWWIGQIPDAGGHHIYFASAEVGSFQRDRTVRYIRSESSVATLGHLGTVPYVAAQLYGIRFDTLDRHLEEEHRFKYLLLPADSYSGDVSESNMMDEDRLRIWYSPSQLFERVRWKEFRQRAPTSIVVVGQSSPETEDIYDTPIGPMPGMYVVGNAINTLVNHDTIHHESPWITKPVELLFILVAAYLFLEFPSLKAAVWSIVAVLAVTSVIMYVAYAYFNMLINPLFPILGMLAHWLIAQFEEARDQQRNQLRHHG